MTNVFKKRPRTAQTERRKPLVVCVDDDPHIAKALRLRLRTMDIDVLRAADGHAGLQLIREQKPDLVISDWWMEHGDGEFLLNRLQSRPDTAQIPVIMVTGVGRPDIMNRMFAQGARSCYTKPLQFDALREDLCTLLDLNLASTPPRRSKATEEKSGMDRRSKRGRNIFRLDSAEDIATSHWRS